MNPVGYILRRQRGKVRTRWAIPVYGIPRPVTSRSPRLVHRVNPLGNLAYIVRTMPRPKPSMVLTALERDRIDADWRAFYMDRQDPLFQSDFLDWRTAVEKYAQAKGLGPVEWYVEEDSFRSGDTTFHWKVRGES